MPGLRRWPLRGGGGRTVNCFFLGSGPEGEPSHTQTHGHGHQRGSSPPSPLSPLVYVGGFSQNRKVKWGELNDALNSVSAPEATPNGPRATTLKLMLLVITAGPVCKSVRVEGQSGGHVPL